MKSKFEYARPTGLTAACRIMEAYDGESRVIAGGTDLMVRVKEWKGIPGLVVDITGIPGLDRIENLEDGGLRIGARVVMRDLIEHPVVCRDYAALRDAMILVGSVQIRNRATLVGNVCNSSPAADTVPPLVIFDAAVEIAGPDSEHTVSILDFITAPGRTLLKRGEIVRAIVIPGPRSRRGSCYRRMARRRAVDLALTAVALSVDERHLVRVSYGAVGPRPIDGVRASATLSALSHPAEAQVREAARVCLEEITPIDDVRASRDYRMEMTAVLVERTYHEARQRLDGGISQ